MASQTVKKVQLQFSANTSQAVSSVQQLNNLLMQIGKTTQIGVDSGQLSQAVSAAQQLQLHLAKATDVNTGKLDLSAFSQSLKSANTDLHTLCSNLQGLGPQGQQAFLLLSQSVAQAEAPMIRMNKTLQGFLTTLANTAKWQLSSSIMHGLVGTLESAVGHAKSLNAALNDIQVVTGYTSTTMANLARDASNAAAALNTTTTEYAKAALIFYQQGLSGSAVQERADVVIKLAQVTGQSAEMVSDQMTAIWNNFDDGRHTLEYYADGLAALGAATAASTSEIAEGLQKFASIADTVGLSYEYAASMIATVVDKTRLSADVVGTSLKTILARMESVSLGESLGDGVDLTKYSQALEDVGVNILKADGSLKDMDDILDELGSKWEGLGRETQVALAQTVGGVKQYNQVMSLMNNWEDVKENIDLASKATGTLTEQQKIWSASYEASLNKLKKAKDDLYEQFINDETLIKFNDILTQVINSFTSFMKKFGGLKSLIISLVGAFSGVLFPMIANGFKKAGNTIQVWTGMAARNVRTMQNQMSAELQSFASNTGISDAVRQQMELQDQLLKKKQELVARSKDMTEAEKKEAEAKIALMELVVQETQALLKNQAAKEENVKAASNALMTDTTMKSNVKTTTVMQNYANGQAKKDWERKTDGSGQFMSNDERTQIVGDIQNYAEQYSAEKLESKAHGDKSQKGKNEKEIARLSAQEEKLQSLEGPLTEEQQEQLTTIREQIEALEEKNQQYDIEIKKLEIAAKLRREMNAMTVDKNTSVGTTRGVEANGSISVQKGDKVEDVYSARLSKDMIGDSDEGLQRQAGAEENQMRAVADTLSGGDVSQDGALEAEASVANYEKLYEAIGKQATQTQKLDAVKKDLVATVKREQAANNALSKAEEAGEKISKKRANKLKNERKFYAQNEKALKKLSKEEQAYVKALLEGDKAGARSINTLKKSKEEYIKLAKEAGATEDALKTLDEAFENLGTENEGAALQNITNVFTELDGASQAVEQDLRTTADAMEQTLIEGGMSAEGVGALTDALKSQAETAPLVDTALENTGNTMKFLGTNTTGMLDKFTSITGSVMQFTGSLAAAVTAGQGLINVFSDEGTGPLEKFMAIMTFASTLIPIVTGATKLLTFAKKEDQAADVKGLAAWPAKLAATAAETGSKWALVAANLAALISNPFTIALAAVALVAIGAMIIGIHAQKEKTDQLTESEGNLAEAKRDQQQATVDQAKETAKLTDTLIDQIATMDALIAKYKELSDAQKNTFDTEKEILDQKEDVLDTYEQIGDTLNPEDQAEFNQLLGSVKNAQTADEFIAATKNMDKFLVDKQQGSLDSGYSNAVAGAANDMYNTIKNDGGKVTTDSSGAIHFNKGYEADSIMADLIANSGLAAEWEGDAKGGIEDGWYTLKIRTTPDSAFIEDYEKLVALKKAAEDTYSSGALADDESYQEIKKLVEAGESAYNDAKEIKGSQSRLNITAGVMNSTILNANKTDPNASVGVSDITDYSTYQAVRNEVATNTGVSEDELDDYFSENGVTKSFVEVDRKINNLVEKNDGDESIRDDLTKLVDEYGADLFLNINTNDYDTVEGIENALNVAQQVADQQPIQVSMEAADNALSALKESGMTSEDWQKVVDSGFDFDAIGGFENFMALDYDKQRELLGQFRDEQAEELTDSMTGIISTITNRMGEITDANGEVLAGYEDEYAALEKELGLWNTKLAIQEKTALASRAEREGFDSKEIEDYMKALKAAGFENEKMAEDAAFAIFHMNEGLKELQSSYADIANTIETCEENSVAYVKAVEQLKNILGQTFNVDNSVLTALFNKEGALETLMPLIEQASLGNAEAIATIQKTLSEAVLESFGKAGISTTSIWGTNNLDLSNMEMGDALSDSVIRSLNNTTLTKDQKEAYLSSLGFTTQFNENGDISSASYNGNASVVADLANMRDTVDVYERDDKANQKVLKDEVDKYYDYNDAVTKAEKSLNKLATAKSRAYGDEYLDYIDKELEGINKSITAQKELSTAISTTMSTDRTELSSKYGFTFNDDGSFANYDDVVANEVDKWNAGYNTYATARIDLDNRLNSGLIGREAYEEELELIEEAWEAVQEGYDDFMDSANEYSEDFDLFEQSQETLESLYDQLSAANLEKVTYSLEIKLEIDNRTLEWLDYQLEKIADDFYSRVEGVSLLIGEIGSDGTLSIGGKLGTMIGNITDYESALETLNSRSTVLGDENYMSDADYKAGLEALYEYTMNDIAAIRELDNTMLAYYSDTITMAQEELASYTERMEHHTAVLDHYSNLMSIIGEEQNYQAMGVILEGQAKVLSNALEVSTKAHTVYAQQAADWKVKMEQALADGDEAAFELYEANWKAAEAAARESQDKMLSDLSAWAEAEKAILENTLADLNKTLEKSLTGGTTFDALNTAMERAASTQEEYLTTTNQIYETTKMMRTAQQAIDTSTNAAAKAKLKNFVTETKAMQEQGKLSQFELDMQQAKYNLLVAEIALEEAQNAKSTVRLQRDSEGNFGYVYTADAKAVNAAQQQFDDAQNALYNKGLEAANGYTDKYKSTMQEMYDSLTELNERYKNGEFESDAEYEAAVLSAKEYYYQQLADYSHLYQVALTADSNIVAEAWSTDFSDMINNTDTWKSHVDGYLTSSSDAFTSWKDTIATIKTITGGDLATLASNVGNITSNNDLLTQSITKDDGVLDAMKAQLDSVKTVTDAYGAQRKSILDTIDAYEQYAERVGTSLNGVGSTSDSGSSNNSNNSTSGSGETAAGYDTGGYTGDWGPSGKIAILHEKELVLNKHDTENLLLTIETLHGILSTIDAYANNQQLSHILSSPGYANLSQAQLEQNVHIEASFPGVTDRNEIEEAFNNLVNKASQYANRK